MECQSSKKNRPDRDHKSKTRYEDDGAVAHTSRRGMDKEENYRRETERRIQQRTEQIVRDAERSKARIFDVPGNREIHKETADFSKSVIYSLLLDDNYQAVRSHLDIQTVKKIQEGEYVDFAKLLPKDRIENDQDDRMELVTKGGNLGFIPSSDKEKRKISLVFLWDGAF